MKLLHLADAVRRHVDAVVRRGQERERRGRLRKRATCVGAHEDRSRRGRRRRAVDLLDDRRAPIRVARDERSSKHVRLSIRPQSNRTSIDRRSDATRVWDVVSAFRRTRDRAGVGPAKAGHHIHAVAFGRRPRHARAGLTIGGSTVTSIGGGTASARPAIVDCQKRSKAPGVLGPIAPRVERARDDEAGLVAARRRDDDRRRPVGRRPGRPGETIGEARIAAHHQQF